MAALFATIQEAVAERRFLVSVHAQNQCDVRGVSSWQIAAGLERATLKRVRPSSRPHPSVVVEQELADGTNVEVVWSWLASTQRAKLVTVYFAGN